MPTRYTSFSKAKNKVSAPSPYDACPPMEGNTVEQLVLEWKQVFAAQRNWASLALLEGGVVSVGLIQAN